MLDDTTRVPLRRADYLSSDDFLSPDASGAVQIVMRFAGVTLTLGVYPG